MARAADVRALEDSCPWLREDFRVALARVADGTAAVSRLYAQDLRVIAELAGQVPRCGFDETGSTPWTSFRHEVALARKVSDRAAGQLVRAALRLTTVLPRAMALLEAGVLTVSRATALVSELESVGDELAALVDEELADKAALLPTWRIEQEVRKAVLRLDPDAAAQRIADKNAGRGVTLSPDVDDQAVVNLTGPAVPLNRWYATVDSKARALEAAGDPRTLDALRFDLATSTYPCDVHSPTDPTLAEPASSRPEQIDRQPDQTAAASAASTDLATDDLADGAAPVPGAPAAGTPAAGTPAAGAPAADAPTGDLAAAEARAAAGLRASFVEAAPLDCRMSRPVQARITLPVETSLGLSNEPGWLDGYGWLSAPTSRQLLLDAELRRVCVQTGTGQLVDLADRELRPPPTPTGLRDSLLAMVLDEIEMNDTGWRTEPQHDPSDRLRDYVTLRDRTCDGPTGARISARRADLDHDDAWPAGPTAAWNLTARGRRTHQHKHRGWTPLRTPTSTIWFSPAGQSVEVPRHASPPPGIDPDPTGLPSRLPDPDDLAHLDQLQLTAPTDAPPWLPAAERDRTEWTWLPADEPAPF